MLTPEQLQSLPIDLMQRYEELAEFVLQDIARRIAKAAEITDTAEYQIYRARALGMSEKEIAAAIAKTNSAAEEDIDRLIREAAEKSDEFERRVFGADDGAAVPLKENEQLQKLLAAEIKNTGSACNNLTKTTGFAEIDANGQVVYSSTTDFLRKQMDMAHMKVATGVTDYNTALRQACRVLAESGLRTVYYASGRSDRIEVAVRRALMTSVSQVVQRISEQNAEQFDANGWEISAHAGARPSHVVYQGRQFPNSQYDTIVRPLIGDYNCRHSAFPIIMGVSTPMYTEEELKNIDPPPFTYKGKTYTAYQAQQQMRKMERAMRKQKDRCIVADAAGDKDSFTAASIKLRRQKDIYEDFAKKADLYTEYERTFVAGYNRRLSAMTGAVTRKQRAFDRAQLRLTDESDSSIIKSADYNAEFSIIVSGQKNMVQAYKTGLEQKFSAGTETAQKVFLKYVKDDSIEDSQYTKGKAHFSRQTQKIKMSFAMDLTDPRGLGSAFFHEHGHYIDYMSGGGTVNTSLKTKKFGDLLRRDFESYIQSVMNTRGINKEKAYVVVSSEVRTSQAHSISDLLGGLSENRCRGLYTHKDSYWKNYGALEREAFAHMFEAQFSPNKYTLMQKYFPSAFSEFENILKGLV